jgi:uncharacterized protein (DUF2062 family)
MTISETVRKLLQESRSPNHSALSFAVGAAISFSPFLGLHFLLALLIAFLFRLNKLEVAMGTLVNNPWTVAFVYSSAFFMGNGLLGWDMPEFTLEAMFSHEIFVPLMIGCLVYMAAAGLLSFFLVRGLLLRRQRKADSGER